MQYGILVLLLGSLRTEQASQPLLWGSMQLHAMQAGLLDCSKKRHVSQAFSLRQADYC